MEGEERRGEERTEKERAEEERAEEERTEEERAEEERAEEERAEEERAEEERSAAISGLTLDPRICPFRSQYFDLATFFWTTCIAFNIFFVFVTDVGHKVKSYEVYYHIASWGVPLIFLIVVFCTDALGDSGNWCWIKKDHMCRLNGVVMRFYPGTASP